jgi:hypothetical protein
MSAYIEKFNLAEIQVAKEAPARTNRSGHEGHDLSKIWDGNVKVIVGELPSARGSSTSDASIARLSIPTSLTAVSGPCHHVARWEDSGQGERADFTPHEGES